MSADGHGLPVVNLILVGAELLLLWQCYKAAAKAWDDRPLPPYVKLPIIPRDPYFLNLTPPIEPYDPPFETPYLDLTYPAAWQNVTCLPPQPVAGARPECLQSQQEACAYFEGNLGKNIEVTANNGQVYQATPNCALNGMNHQGDPIWIVESWTMWNADCPNPINVDGATGGGFFAYDDDEGPCLPR